MSSAAPPPRAASPRPTERWYWSRRTLMIGQLIEVGAAFCVLLFGAALLMASLSGMITTA